MTPSPADVPPKDLLLFVVECRAALNLERGQAIYKASAADEWVRPPRSNVPLRLQRPTAQSGASAQ